ncbi:MAG TPA: hypothetical protein VHG89_02070 [Verrucomicrobiae bacterium]|nr:hypothetical protein [Verrucomicrobiae bacterium]
MKLKFFWPAFLGVCAILLCHKSSADALDKWHWLNPLPTGNSLYGISFAVNRFIAVGTSGSVLNSVDGVNWIASSPVTTSTLNAVAWGNGLFVAVGNNGTIQTSSDGTNWTIQISGTTSSLEAVTFGNGIFVAVGTGGTIVISTNGVNWTSANSGVTDNLTGMSWGNNVFIATCAADKITASKILRSIDGVNWTSETLTYIDPHYGPLNSGYAPLNAVSFINGSFVVVAGIYFEPTLYYQVFKNAYFYSTDGVSWSTNTSDLSINCHFITFGNGTYFVGGDQPQISTDGQFWTGAVTSGYFTGNACAFGNGVFVMVSTNGLILTSANALTWTNQNFGSHATLTGMAYGNGVSVAVGGSYILPPVYNKPSDAIILVSSNGLPFQTQITPSKPLSSVVFSSSVFTAVGQSGLILQSTNGLSWTQCNSGTTYALNGIAVGGGSLIAVGDNGTIQTSPSGLVWTGRSSGTVEPLYAITYANELFVAVGYSGTVLTSPDGVNWTAQYSGELSDLLSITYGSAGFVAVGANGVIVTSPDGVNWTSQNSGTTNQLVSVSYGNGYYITAGAPFTSLIGLSGGYPFANVTLTSLDGVVWTMRTPLASEYDLLGTAFINNCFMLVGNDGVILKSDDTATMPLGLQIQAKSNSINLVINAPVGSSFRLQGCANLSGPAWVDVAAFTNVLAATQWSDMATNSARFYRAVSP